MKKMYYQIHPPFIMLIELATNTENTANANANTKSRLLYFFPDARRSSLSTVTISKSYKYQGEGGPH